MANFQMTKLVLDALRKEGATFVPFTWPVDPATNAMSCILNVEAGAAFADITRDNTVDRMVLQDASAWPTTFRSATFVSAVDYVLANRARSLMIQRLDEMFKDVDVVVGAGSSAMTNLSGHPQIVVPTAVGDTRNQGISFVAALYREDLLLRLAHAWQRASDVHLKRPPKFS